MNKNYFLHLSSKNKQEIKLEPRFYTVGCGPNFDICVDSNSSGQLFSLLVQEQKVELIPYHSHLQLNGLKLKSSGHMKDLDRITWDGGAGVLIEKTPSILNVNSKNTALNPVEVLEKITNSLESQVSFPLALQQLLDFIMSASLAQNCALMWESTDSEWEIIAKRVSSPDIDLRSKTLLSQTILREALENKDLVYVESLVGHSWANALSVIENNLYSVAVIPLMIGHRAKGALFLSTQEAGRSLRKDNLENLRSITTMTSLLVMAIKQNEQLKTQKSNNINFGVQAILGKSQKINELKQKILKLASTPLPVYIKGPSGSGKELVARALHEESDRNKAPFIAINCAAIPGSLFEATLFGHTKGAFTGANYARQGKFEQANNGTLFLDEIADLPLELQAKLLRVLQEGIIDPIGSAHSKKINVRILCATHQDLQVLVQEKKFREDLYYRLASAVIKIPSLKDRSEDISLLAHHFLLLTGQQKTISLEAIDLINRYPWPGNIRQLKQSIERAAYLADGIEIQSLDLDLPTSETDYSELSTPESVALDVSLKIAQKNFTKQYIERVVTQSASRTEAASRLCISERTLYRLLEE